jgi:GNAT superfamily N-acetyltransferase
MATTEIIIREGRKDDLAALIAIFAADDVGGHGDTVAPEAFHNYARAFEIIAASPDQMLYVAERGNEIVGTFQISIATTLTGRGASFMIVEAVQTRADMRGQGIGVRMIEFCIAEAKGRGFPASSSPPTSSGKMPTVSTKGWGSSPRTLASRWP